MSTLHRFVSLRIRNFLFLLLVCVEAVLPLTGEAQVYSVVSLYPYLDSAIALNQRGQVLGVNGSDGVLISPGGTISRMNLPAFPPYGPTAINNYTQVLANVFVPGEWGWNLNGDAYVVSNGVATKLSTLGGISSYAVALNDHGVIVGDSDNGSTVNDIDGFPRNVVRASLWRNGTIADLGTLGGTHSHARAVNSAGQVVGYADLSDRSHAFRFSQGQITDLGTLGGRFSYASAINDAGDVVGTSDLAGDMIQHALLVDTNGMRDLGALDARHSEGVAINAHAQVVGNLRYESSQRVGFLHFDGSMKKLTDLLPATSGWTIGEVNAINDAGQILATGFDENGGGPVLLSPPLLVALEFNQAIQDWRNSVPLVEEKPTLVRAFFRTLGINELPVEARLKGFTLDGMELPKSPLEPCNAGGFCMATTSRFPDRTNLNSSLNFELPSEWLRGNIRLYLEWPNSTPVTMQPLLDSGMTNKTVHELAFTRVEAFPVTLVRVSWIGPDRNYHEPSKPQMYEMDRRLQAIYPISRTILRIRRMPWRLGAPSSGGKVSLAALNSELFEMRRKEQEDNPYYGAFVDYNEGGQGSKPLQVGCGFLSAVPFDYSRNLPAHELGHVLGRPHAVHSSLGTNTNGDAQGICGETAPLSVQDFPMDFSLGHTLPLPTLGPIDQGDYSLAFGFDSHVQRVISPFETFDLMSYVGGDDCPFGTGWRWCSTFTYTNLLDAVLDSTRQVARPLKVEKNMMSLLSVRGAIDIETDRIIAFNASIESHSRQPPSLAIGRYTLRIEDYSRNVLREVHFRPEIPESERRTTEGLFALELPLSPTAKRVVLLADERELVARNISSNAPSVCLVAPNGGETIRDRLTARWTASDVDGDKLTFTLQFSPDDGQSWQTIIDDSTESHFEIQAEDLVGTMRGRIRVIASDGVNQSEDVSDGHIFVPNRPPHVEIVSPQHDAMAWGRQNIIFKAYVHDAEDDVFPDSAIIWASNRDGVLGQGEDLHLNATRLSEGTHVITVTVTDSGKRTTSASINLRILKAQLLSLHIERMGNSVEVSWSAESRDAVLQSTEFLGQASNWQPVVISPILVDNRYRIRASLDDQTRYFRLAKQNEIAPLNFPRRIESRPNL